MPRESIKRLREERAVLGNEIRTLADKIDAEKRDFSADEQKKWDKVNGDYNALTRRIEHQERADRIDADQAERLDRREARNAERLGRGDSRTKPTERQDQATEKHRALALQAWCRRSNGLPLTKKQRIACKRVNLNPGAKQIDLQLRTGAYNDVRAEFRALSAQLVATGAYTVPEGFVNNLERALLMFGGIRQVADVMRTESGGEMPWPTVNDTSNTGEIIGENVAQNEAEPSFGSVVFHAYKFSSKLIRVPAELLEDSAFNVAATLGMMLGERIGRIQNTRFTTGTGSNQPRGVVTSATTGKTSAVATAIAFDELIDLVHSVDPAYRPAAKFMMHDSIMAVVRKLKDGNGNYLWQPSNQAGVPDRLLNYPVQANQDMQSSVATGTTTVLFGDLSKYKIRDVGSFRMRRLVERYADQDQEGFVGFLRGDGNLLDAGTHPVKALVQA